MLYELGIREEFFVLTANSAFLFNQNRGRFRQTCNQK